MTVEAFVDEALAWIRAAPPALSLSALAASAAIEYVCPPFPGDTIVLAGGLIAGQGALPLWSTYLAICFGSVAGTIGAWSIGYAAQRLPWLRALLVRFLTEERLARVVESYRRRGKLIVLVNRFLPGVRSTFLFAAGIAGVPLRVVVLYGTLSALLWNGLLVAGGFALGQNLDRMMAALRTYATVAWVLALCAVAYFVGSALWRRFKKPAAP